MSRVARIVTVLYCLLLAVPLHAHKLAPSLLSLREVSPLQFEVSWKTPRFASTPVPIEPQLPAACPAMGERTWAYDGTGVRVDWSIRCASPLQGQTLAVNGLGENQSAALVRVEWLDGVVSQGMLSAEQPRYSVPAQADSVEVAGDYTRLGVSHILGGPDHLLFVLALLLLVSNRRVLVWTITAFTLGHSITLALAALGYLRFPVDLIEFAIALSIFVLAVELTRDNNDAHWLRHRPWLAAVLFGLLHGMGFASALLDVGLPAHDIPLALLSFNVGIEVGQLLFVGAVLLARWAWLAGGLPMRPALRWAPVYLIGIGSAYWSMERAAAVLSGV